MNRVSFEAKEKYLLEQIANDNVDAMYLLGVHYYTNGYLEKAYIWFERATIAGHGDSYYYLGVLYENADGYIWANENATQDIHQAMLYYAIGTDLESPKATFKLGTAYLYGIEGYLRPNVEKGIELLLKAAEYKNAEACKELALCYEKGIGVEMDLEKSLEYAKKAVELLQDEK